MSAMEKMLLGGLVKAAPPEVAKWLSPEGIKQLGEKAGDIAKFIQTAHNITIDQNAAILANQKEIMEALNVRDKFNSGPEYTRGGAVADSGDSEQRSAAA